MIQQLIATLCADDKDLDWRDLADILWLWHVIGPSSAVLAADDRPSANLAGAVAQDETTESTSTAIMSDVSGSIAAGAPATEPQLALQPGVAEDGGGLALDVRVPARLALPGRLEIGRALRTFKQSRRSRRDRVFDSQATIDHYCDTKLLVPIMVLARERWFQDVAVVADGSPTMAVWRDTIAALADLLERHGAFDRVTRWTLVGDDDEVYVESRTGLRHDPHELVDYDGRRLILVVTDCVDILWRGSAAWAALRDWGCFAPVALVQTLPARLWPATALGDADVAMTSHGRGEPNRQLRLRPPWWWEGDPPEQATPVVTLDERRMGAWARMVMGAGSVEVAGIITQPPHSAELDTAAAPIDAQTRVATFRATVSEEAARLATLLSAVDVSLPVAQLVLDALIPNARQTHLAEVLISGLLQPAGLVDDPPSATTYNFVPGVREILQESLTTTATIDVWRTVAPHLEAATGQRPPFSMLLAPDAPMPRRSADSDIGRIATDLINRLGLTHPMPTAIRGATTAVSATSEEVTAGEALRQPSESPEPVSGPTRPVLQFIGIAVSRYDDPLYQPMPRALRDVRAIGGSFSGQSAQAEILVDPTVAETHERLRPLFHRSDAAFVYWAGHAISQFQELWLVARDTGSRARAVDVVRIRSIIESALDAGVRQLMLILDTELNGVAGAPGLSDQLSDLASPLESASWVGVLASSHSSEGPDSGRLAEAIVKLLREGPSWGGYRAHWSAHNDRVRGIDFLEALREEWPIGLEQPRLTMLGLSNPLLPNPRYDVSTVPLPYFLARREQLDEFQRLLDDHEGGWALHYIGMSGVGKTTLLRHIRTDLAPRLGIPTSRIDFAYINPDYPVRWPGLLLSELADELRAHATSQRQEELFGGLQDRLIQLHEHLHDQSLESGPLAAVQGTSFDRVLHAFGDLLQLLPQPVLFILDSCEELVKLRPAEATIPAVEVTFSILERLHDQVPTLRVVFAGRRLLAQYGLGWGVDESSRQEGTALLPAHKEYLRLHEIGGFTEAEAITFLTHVNQLAPSEELLRAILARSRAPIEPAAIVWKTPPPSIPDARYIPFDLALYADWIREDPTLGPEAIASGGSDPYIATRIIRRLQGPVLRLLPAVALLGRFDEAMLRPVADRDEDVADAFRELSSMEWIDYQYDAALQSSSILEVERNVQHRLLAYYRENPARRPVLDEAARRLGSGLSALIRERPFHRLRVEHIDAALKLLPLDQAATLWDRLELRIADEAIWDWADVVIGRLLGKDGAVGAADHPLRAAVQATYCAVVTHTRPNIDLTPLWIQVAELAPAHPDPRTGYWLRQRAVAGQVAAIGASSQRPSDELLTGFWELLAAASHDAAADVADKLGRLRIEQLAGSFSAALEALLEHAERTDDTGLLPLGTEDRVDAWVTAIASADVSSTITAFAHMLAGRAAVLHRQWQKATVSLEAAAAALSNATNQPKTQSWLDWRTPTSLGERIRLETMRVPSPEIEVNGRPLDSATRPPQIRPPLPDEGVADLIVVVPGFSGSTLVRDGREVWGTSLKTLARTTIALGQSLRSLTVPAGLGDDQPGDGVTAGRLMPDMTIVPGFWSTRIGYNGLLDRLRRIKGMLYSGDPITFPYDWRLSHRYSARRLAQTVQPLLERWRGTSGRPDARLRLLCYAEGGLVARWYLDYEGGAEVTRQLITIGTPYRGTIYALEKLVNGMRTSFGLDLTEMFRSLPSMYQMLPDYRCIEWNGSLHNIDKVDLPGVDTATLAGGRSFLTSLRESSPGSYSTHMIIGLEQPTPITARLEGDRLSSINTYEGVDYGGDGMVSRLSAIPPELDRAAAFSVPDRHAALLDNSSVLSQIEGLLTSITLPPIL